MVCSSVSSKKLPDETLIEMETKEQVMTALKGLPDEERTVTMLFYIGGYRQQDITDFDALPISYTPFPFRAPL